MVSRKTWKAGAVVVGALGLGFLAGCWVKSRVGVHLPFLRRATAFGQREQNIGGNIEAISYYSVDGDWTKLISQAKRELPTAIVRDAEIGGIEAKVFTIPRVENGHLQLEYPPQQEITFMPRRFVLNRHGVVVAISQPNSYTGVELREFRQSRPLDGVVEWFRKTLRS